MTGFGRSGALLFVLLVGLGRALATVAAGGVVAAVFVGSGLWAYRVLGLPVTDPLALILGSAWALVGVLATVGAGWETVTATVALQRRAVLLARRRATRAATRASHRLDTGR